jgi:hypothetical protein
MERAMFIQARLGVGVKIFFKTFLKKYGVFGQIGAFLRNNRTINPPEKPQ